MSYIKEYVDNFTDEQILSSAYMCCQRNAVKAVRNNLNESNARRSNFSTRQGKRDFKQMHRDTYISIPIVGFIKVYILLLIIFACAIALVECFKPDLGKILEKIFPYIMIAILLFPIVRKVIIEARISKAYKDIKSRYDECLEADTPVETRLSLQLNDMDAFLSQNCVIPEKYWDYALNLVEYIYIDYRATNLREAINILEEDLHRQRLENKMYEIEQMSIENTNAINEIFNRIDNIECFQDFLNHRQNNLENRQANLEWDNIALRNRVNY
ncbi:MAG: hypothetical protein ACI4SF_00985 [Oscillospiraceae bacterium]